MLSTSISLDMFGFLGQDHRHKSVAIQIPHDADDTDEPCRGSNSDHCVGGGDSASASQRQTIL